MIRKLHYLILLVFVIISSVLKAQTVDITNVLMPGNATSCSTNAITINVTSGCNNWTYINTTFSVNGNTIDVSVNYTAPFICLGALAFNVHTPTLPALAGGTYTVSVKTYAGGVLEDVWPNTSLNVVSCGPMASFDLSQDTLCLGDSILATNTSTGSTSYTWYYNNSLYSTDTNETFQPGAVGTAEITLIATDGSAFDTATAFVEVFDAAPQIELGNDTAVCGYDSISIGLNNAFVSTLWSTGDTSQLISVGPGEYMVTVSGLESCEAMDTIVINELEIPTLEIHEISANNCDFAEINADTGFASYQWSTGANQQQVQVTVTDTYYVTATTVQGCTTEASSFVEVFGPPTVDLGNDTVFCKNANWQLNLTAPNFGTWVWNDGSSSLIKSIFGVKGEYWIEVTDENGCVGSDTIEIKEKKCLGIQEMVGDANIIVYPNPSTGFINVAASTDVDEISILDLTGAQVVRIDDVGRGARLNLSNLPNGIYFIEVLTEDGITSEKIQLVK